MHDHRTLDQMIADSLSKAEADGELLHAKNRGKPLDFGDGFDETPLELRSGYKILKDAGHVPVEVQMLRELEALRERLSSASEAERPALIEKITDLQLRVNLRMEGLRR